MKRSSYLCIREDDLGMSAADDWASEHRPARHGVLESLLHGDATWPPADVDHVEFALTEPHAVGRLIIASFDM